MRTKHLLKCFLVIIVGTAGRRILDPGLRALHHNLLGPFACKSDIGASGTRGPAFEVWTASLMPCETCWTSTRQACFGITRPLVGSEWAVQRMPGLLCSWAGGLVACVSDSFDVFKACRRLP